MTMEELIEMIEYCRALFYTPKHKSGCVVKEDIEHEGIRWEWSMGDRFVGICPDGEYSSPFMVGHNTMPWDMEKHRSDAIPLPNGLQWLVLIKDNYYLKPHGNGWCVGQLLFDPARDRDLPLPIASHKDPSYAGYLAHKELNMKPKSISKTNRDFELFLGRSTQHREGY